MPEVEYVALHMGVAVLCGMLIGLERQARQRMAGVRTNALVALGAASFVTFSGLFPGEPSQTRVAAQIVSGIGFLGAGLIFRDGFRLHGLNTAATLWCSAAVGMFCGAGALALAALLTGTVLALNLLLRPIVNWLDRTVLQAGLDERRYRLRLVCRAEREAGLRATVLRDLVAGGLRLIEIDVHPAADSAAREVVAVFAGPASDALLERAVALLGSEPDVSHADWQALDGQ